jgi:TPR repeat protein
MGLCNFGNDFGVNEDDYQKAHEYLKKSSEMGNALANYYLGLIYEYGYGVEEKKDLEKSFNYYQLSIEMGCYWSNISNLISLGKKLNKKMDYPKIVGYFLQFFKFKNLKDNNYAYNKNIENLKEILSQKYVEWREDLHKYWNPSKEVKGKIIYLLLISKNRKESSNHLCSFLVKGITINIIKYFCHFTQE